MRFLCDEMLGGLGRWLRAAGYDTAIAAGGLHDRCLIRRCAAEGRILITRDKALAAAAAGAARVLALPAGLLEADARTLRERLGVDWQYAPFTRCLVDNAPLAPAAPHQAQAVPATSRRAGGPVRVCPACRRVYWPGGHVRRIQARLTRWQE